MIERVVFRPIYCPVCGRFLLKAKDESEVVVHCEKCNSDIIATVRTGIIATMEDRRDKLPIRNGAVSISVVKDKSQENEKRRGKEICLNTKAM